MLPEIVVYRILHGIPGGRLVMLLAVLHEGQRGRKRLLVTENVEAVRIGHIIGRGDYLLEILFFLSCYFAGYAGYPDAAFRAFPVPDKNAGSELPPVGFTVGRYRQPLPRLAGFDAGVS